MRLATWFGTAVAASLIGLAATPAATAAPAPSPVRAGAAAAAKPNIIVILTDDQDDIGSMAEMPQLQALAARGVTFTNSFVDFPLCCPSRASFLTGQAAHNSGVEGNKPPNGGYQLLRSSEGNTLGVWMQQAGYRTALMGKLMNGYGEDASSRTHIMPGWNEWDVSSDPTGPYRYYNYVLNENGLLKRYHHTVREYQTDVLAAKGAAFITAGTDPFFLLLQPIAPHGQHDDESEDGARGDPLPADRDVGVYATLPMHPTANFNEKDVSDKPGMIRSLPKVEPGEMLRSFRARRETMLAVDDMIKTLTDALTAAGKLDNTIIVFTSDNGYSEGSHRWQGKIVLYEESLRVPLVIAGPVTPRGQTRDQLVNNLDVVASVLDWAGAKPGRTLDGRPLQPVLDDPGAAWRTGILVENNHAVGIRTKDWVYSELKSGQWGAERELYNLDADHLELRNIADRPAYASQIASLKASLDVLAHCQGRTCWMDSAPPPPPGPGR